MELLYFMLLLVPSVFCDVEVTTSQGKLRGQVLYSRFGNKYFSFSGIPYGQPPVANLRFMPPQPAKNWTGILNATRPSPKCYQWDYVTSKAIGQEDCLYLNVFTPKISNESLPVMIYIYGGSFMVGDAGPVKSAKYFMEEPVVLVIPNYRLGRLGFLSLEDELIPGNMGLKDQALAVEWVRKEISAFGGNPNLITIFGNSAGGASAHYLCSAPRLSGLIKGCISQSGVGGIASWALSRPGEARGAALKIAQALGCEKNETLTCLQSKSVEEVTNSFLISPNEKGARHIPVIESPSDHAIITSWPSQRNDFPWITGITADEGMILTASVEFNLTNQIFTEDELVKYLKAIIRDTLRLENQTDIERVYKRFTANESNLILAGRKFGTEALFLFPALEALKQHNGPKYFYIFDYIGGPSFYEVFLNKDLNITGVCHNDDFPYLFYMPDKFKPKRWPTRRDTWVSYVLIKIWVSFAKNQSPLNTQCLWKTFDDKSFMEISNDRLYNIKTFEDYEDVYNFWNGII